MYELTEREKVILRDIIHQFILTANPVGSRNLAKKSDLHLSPASIRNIMSDLEEAGFLQHPHTSAGRVPTDKGYRFYVNSLMSPAHLDFKEKRTIESELETLASDTEDLLQLTASILSRITNQLACVTYPKIDNSRLERIQIISLSSSKILVVVEISSGLVKTVTLEVDGNYKKENLPVVQSLLNEKLAGLKFTEIRQTFKDRIADCDNEIKPIVRVFFNSADKIFADENPRNKIFIAGATNIVKQPEFESIDQFESIIELVENRDVIVHIMEKNYLSKPADVIIKIGSENEDDKLARYSLIKKQYLAGESEGIVGIIGPKRMEYSKTIAAIIYIAELLTKEFKNI